MTIEFPNRSRGRRRGLLPALAATFVACLVVLAGPAVLAADEPSPLTIRRYDATDPEKVTVDFIWNGDRKALQELTVREGGEERKHSTVVPLSKVGVEPAIVFAIDTSQSMARNGGVAEVKKTLSTMIDDLEGNEAMGIVTFGTNVEKLSPITSDKAQLDDAVEDIVAPSHAGTSMWDGVKTAASMFRPTSDLQPNIVLITDGYDDSSTTSASRARSAVTRSGAAVFALAYNAQGHLDDEALDTLVTRAGGAVIPAPERKDLSKGLEQVETSLANQYTMSFASEGERGSTDLEIGVGSDSAKITMVSGAESQGTGNLAPPESSRSLVPGFFRGTFGMMAAVIAGGLAVALAVIAVIMVVSKDETSLDHVLRQYTEPVSTDPDADDADEGIVQSAFVQRAVELTGELADKQGILIKVEKKLEQADLPLRAAEALFFYLAGAVVVTLLGLIALGIMGILIFGLLGFIAPIAVLNFLGSRRQKKFDSQLPDTLSLLAGSLRAGYSLVQGVDAVSQEVDGPMGRELRRVMTEAQLGRELEDALEAASARVQSKDFAWAIMAIRIQREVGGNLSELLMTVADTMVERERLRRDVNTLTAEGKISAIVLGGLPAVLGVVMYVVNPTYMGQLFNETAGHYMLLTSVVMMLIGFAWMKKTITIEV